MSVIIRLQGLPWAATAVDIRRFFSGLTIPDGGVHIVGGDHGDAFIAFATDEEARKATLFSGQRICGALVRLQLSSRAEMQNVIEQIRGSKTKEVPPPMRPTKAVTMNPLKPLSHIGGSTALTPLRPQQKRGVAVASSAMGFGMTPNQTMGMAQNQPMGFAPNQAMGSTPSQNMGMTANQTMGLSQVPSGMAQVPGIGMPQTPSMGLAQTPTMGMPQTPTIGMPQNPSMLGMTTPNMGMLQSPPNTMGMLPTPNVGRLPNPNVMQQPSMLGRTGLSQSPMTMNSPMSYPGSNGAMFGTNQQFADPLLAPKTCAECRGFDPKGSYRQIRRFFGKACETIQDGIKIVLDESGKKTGHCFVKFVSTPAYENALKLDRKEYEGSMIRVYPCYEHEWANAVDQQTRRTFSTPLGDNSPMRQRIRSRSPLSRGMGGSVDLRCVVIRGLPELFDKKDAFELAKVPGCVANKTYVEFDNHRKCMGRMFLQFLTPDQAQQAVASGSFQPFEANLISSNDMFHCIQSHKEAMGKLRGRPNQKPSLNTSSNKKPSTPSKTSDEKNEGPTSCVKIENIPASVRGGDLIQFFRPFELVHKGVFILYGAKPSEKPSMAFAEFMTAAVCERAIAKYNGKSIVGSTLSLTPISKEERNRLKDAYLEKKRVRKQEVHDSFGGTKVLISNLPSGIRPRALEDIFSSYGVVSGSILVSENKSSATMSFTSKSDAELAVQELNNKMIMGKTVLLKMT